MALPRQRDVTAEARRTEVSALATSVRSAARFGHSLWQAGGAPDVLTVARGRVRFVNGYPSANDLPLLLERSETLAFAHSAGEWQHRDSSATRLCGVSYAPPARRGQPPRIELEASGC